MDCQISSRLKELEIIFLDMDGTLYMGDQLFEWTPVFLNGLREYGLRAVFLTNNSSRSRSAYHEKLAGMGINVNQEDIYTSGDATIDYLRQLGASRIYLMGTASLEKSFQEAGFVLANNAVDMVVMGYDKTLTYEKLNRAYHHIAEGVPWCATHPDLLCPTPDGFDIDLGAMMQSLIHATGVQPKIIGKPHAEMTGPLLKRLGVDPSRVAIMGDRLYTDIQTGLNGGLLSVLVLTGEAGREDVANSDIQPHLILERNVDLLSYL